MEEEKEVVKNTDNDSPSLVVASTNQEKVDGNSGSKQDLSGDVSCSKFMQKKLEKAKKKALQYGYTVPDLRYPLEKPLKQRTALAVLGYLIFALGIIISLLAIYFTYKVGLWSTLFSAFGISSDALSESTLNKTFGLSQIKGFVGIVIIIILITIVLALVGICSWIISFGLRVARVSKVSRQEMAKGYEVFDTIGIMFLLSAIGIAGIVVSIVGLGLKTNTWIICGVLALCIALFLTIAIILIVERKKEAKWFETLSKEMQEDFIEYNNVIKKYSAKGNAKTLGRLNRRR